MRKTWSDEAWEDYFIWRTLDKKLNERCSVMEKYVCSICGYVYNPIEHGGIAFAVRVLQQCVDAVYGAEGFRVRLIIHPALDLAHREGKPRGQEGALLRAHPFEMG